MSLAPTSPNHVLVLWESVSVQLPQETSAPDSLRKNQTDQAPLQGLNPRKSCLM